MIKSTNITWHDVHVSREDREKRNGHRGAVIWLTGLSGSGKSTIACEVDRQLHELGARSYILDGDNVRHGLNRDLGFSPEDRAENIRRIGEVAKLFAESGALVLTAFISPYRADRDLVREIMTREGDFIEVHVAAPLEVCEERDPKGLYVKARAGEIPNFTGIGAPYEEPLDPELVIDTGALDVPASAGLVLEYLREHGYIESTGSESE
ncbi:MAG: adenylyl-sulfate kinase [Gemmatimonadota bacterium]